MGQRQEKNRGVLLGLAVGDAMGHTVDRRSLEEIRNDYGPNGLLGYDLVNGYADITSYTQLAAFTANGLILGLTRGQSQGRIYNLIRYITVAIREWSRSQTFSLPEKNYCWLSGVPEMRRKFCMDNRMLDALSRETLGSLEDIQYKSDHPGSLTTVIPIALLGSDLELSQEEMDRLGAETVALTHGEPLAFLSGAALAYMIAGIVQDRDSSLEAQFKLNPVRLAMDPASFPVAAKDMATLRGLDVGVPYLPNLPTPEGNTMEGFRRTMRDAGLL